MRPAVCTELPVTTVRINLVTPFTPSFLPCLSSVSSNLGRTCPSGEPLPPRATVGLRVCLFLYSGGSKLTKKKGSAPQCLEITCFCSPGCSGGSYGIDGDLQAHPGSSALIALPLLIWEDPAGSDRPVQRIGCFASSLYLSFTSP